MKNKHLKLSKGVLAALLACSTVPFCLQPVSAEVSPYYFDGGMMKPDSSYWIQENGRWRYAEKYGDYIYYANSLIWIGYDCYIFSDDGYMLTNGWYDAYRICRNSPDEGPYCRYLQPNGIAYKNQWAMIDGNWYHFSMCANVAQNEWIEENGSWYYCQKDGKMAKGWVMISTKSDQWRDCWYYFAPSGKMASNTWLPGPNGKQYYVNANGQWSKTWYPDGTTEDVQFPLTKR